MLVESPCSSSVSTKPLDLRRQAASGGLIIIKPKHSNTRTQRKVTHKQIVRKEGEEERSPRGVTSTYQHSWDSRTRRGKVVHSDSVMALGSGPGLRCELLGSGTIQLLGGVEASSRSLSQKLCLREGGKGAEVSPHLSHLRDPL